MLLENEVLTVLGLYMETLVKELFKQLRNETPEKFLPWKFSHCLANEQTDKPMALKRILLFNLP